MVAPISLKNVQISESLVESVHVGVVMLRGLSVGEQKPELSRTIAGTTDELQRSMVDREPSTLDPVMRSRRLYHQLGIDPTKQRPSSEKLLRRVLARKPFPRINDFVDAMNLVSLRLQFPLGLYDWDRISTPILLRMGSPNESYLGISGATVKLDGKLVLVDGEGPFGNPTHDSARTAIETRCVRALVTLFGPADTPRTEFQEGIEEVTRAAGECCGGQVVISGILP